MPKTITISIAPDGTSTIEAYCLATDSWQDYEHFSEQADKHAALGNMRIANREMRAALLCLFSHLEGVVGQIIQKNTDNIEGANKANTLCDKTAVITKEAKKNGLVPDLNFRLGKYLRDIVVHPGIEKIFGGETIDEAAVFKKLDIDTLQNLAERVSCWLDCVCPVFSTSRFTDTKGLVGFFSEALGGDAPIEER